MDRVRAALHAEEIHKAGIFGDGVTVCSLDSGAAVSHPDFKGRIVGFADFVNGRAQGNNRVSHGHEGAARDRNDVSRGYDDASHGTHVLGIIGGNGSGSKGRYRGIAPGCSLLPVKVLDRKGEGEAEDLLRAIDWVIANRDRYSIRILNLSAGGTKGELDTGAGLLVQKVEEAWDAGLVVIVAAGNGGPEPMTITVPGTSRKVITVGACEMPGEHSNAAGDSKDSTVHEHGIVDRSDRSSMVNERRIVDESRKRSLYEPLKDRSGYSGCGPTLECICKPDVVAPGNQIVSCAAAWQRGRYYSIKSGTSMSAPAIAGSIALLLSREPALSNVEVKMRLRESCINLGLPRNRQGWGMPDLRKLLQLKTYCESGEIVVR